MNSTLRANRSKIILFTGFLTLYLVDSSSSGQRDKKRPHIVIIVADDLGWNDVSFHGSNQIPTPNIDALAYNGVILNRHYVQPTCTPSRAALLTGKYPISYGLQGTPIHACEAIGLSMDEKILPQQGSFTGKDARRGFKRAGNEMADQYVTDVFTEEARKVIKSCKPQENPMFLMISHLAVHTGNPGPNLLDVSNKTNNDKRFDYIENNYRRLYAGMLTSLDDSVGAIIESLDENGMLEDSIVLFLSDNGAPTEDPLWGYANFGSNWPLRGEKTSVLDGAVRGVAAIWSRWLKGKHTVSENLFHLTDWLPTLYTAAGGDVKNLGKINGVDQWNSLTNTTKQMRSTILINIDEIRGEEALISNQWKVVKSNRTSKLAFALAYSGDRGNVGPDYDMSNVIRSVAGSRLSRINRLACKEEDCADTTSTARDLFYRVRSQAKIEDKCAERVSDPHPGERYECFDGYCLFDLHDDPCEYRNLAGQKREILNAAIAVLDGYRKEMTRQNRLACDPNADPKRHDGYWDNWMESCNHRRN